MWERRDRKEKDWVKERERGVNRVSDQGLVPLDVAALTHNSPLLHVLTKAGARHNPVCEFEKKNPSSYFWWDVVIDLFICVLKCVNQQSGHLNWKLWWHWQGSGWKKGRWNRWRSRCQGHRPRLTSTGKSACGASGCSCTVGWGRTSSRQVSGLGPGGDLS